MISPYKPISLPFPYPYQKFPIPPFLKISIPLLKMGVQTMFGNYYSRTGQAKLCHHPPPPSITHHQPKCIHHHPPPPISSQNVSTTTHHHPPPTKIYPLTPTTTHQQQTFFIRNPFIRISSHCLMAT